MQIFQAVSSTLWRAPKKPALVPALWVALIFCAVGPGVVEAQGVFKCTVAGKTVYQSAPCTGQGKAVDIAPGPSEAQVEESRRRAEAEKGRAGTYRPPAAQPAAAAPANASVDCAALNQQRADAFGRRNAAVRSSRETNIDQSAAVNRSEADIRQIERQMVSGGCKPT